MHILEVVWLEDRNQHKLVGYMKVLEHDKMVLGLHDGSNGDAYVFVAFYILVYKTLLLVHRIRIWEHIPH